MFGESSSSSRFLDSRTQTRCGTVLVPLAQAAGVHAHIWSAHLLPARFHISECAQACFLKPTAWMRLGALMVCCSAGATPPSLGWGEAWWCLLGEFFPDACPLRLLFTQQRLVAPAAGAVVEVSQGSCSGATRTACQRDVSTRHLPVGSPGLESASFPPDARPLCWVSAVTGPPVG